MDDLIELPFSFLRAPNLKLKTPHFSLPSSSVVFVFVFLSYFLVASGIIYDVIVEPPSIGSATDEQTGAVKPVVFLQHRLNGQFIIEGLSAGMLFGLGGLGFIILDLSNKKNTSDTPRFMLIFTGGIFVVLAYVLTLVFLRIKIPGYLH